MSDQRLSAREGLYAVDFGDRVKIGITGNLRCRLQDHVRAGGKQFRAYPVSRTFMYRPDLWAQAAWRLSSAEDAALAEAARRGRQIGKSEYFTELTLDDATECVRDAFTAHVGGPVHETRPTVVDIYGPLDLSTGGLPQVLIDRVTQRALAAVERYAA